MLLTKCYNCCFDPARPSDLNGRFFLLVPDERIRIGICQNKKKIPFLFWRVERSLARPPAWDLFFHMQQCIASVHFKCLRFKLKETINYDRLHNNRVVTANFRILFSKVKKSIWNFPKMFICTAILCVCISTIPGVIHFFVFIDCKFEIFCRSQ